MTPPSKHAMEAAKIVQEHAFVSHAEVIQSAIDAAVKEEVAPLVQALLRVTDYPISSEPESAGYNLQNIADDAIAHAKAKGWL